MGHLNNDVCQMYIQDQLNEQKRSEVEEHLYSCQKCMMIYVGIASKEAIDIPESVNTNKFTEQILSMVPVEDHYNRVVGKKPFYQHSIFHYGVAAAITIALMTSGFFTSMTSIIATVNTSHEHKSSITEMMMDKTISWIEQVEPDKGRNIK